MNLDRNLLTSAEGPATFQSCWNARGSYHTLQFVLRLRPDVHAALESASHHRWTADLTFDQAQAFSTYLHETIHWWQHIGSTFGLVLSMLQPAHTHANRRRLQQILESGEAVKPLKRLAEEQLHEARQSPQKESTTVVLNNWHDLEFFRHLVLNPENTKIVANNEYFLSVGHAFHLALRSNAWLLLATIDPTNEVLPDPRSWEDEIAKLKKQRVEGFYKGSSIRVPPLGAKDIFEGQARFSQLQYLFAGSNGNLTWAHFSDIQMLDGVYVHAFTVFLAILEREEWPADLAHPLVGLFLLICDLALNPGEGILFPLTDAQRLILATDPGWRFTRLCEAARDEEWMQEAIKEYSATEYWNVSNALSLAISSPSPYRIASTVAKWGVEHSGWRSLLHEDQTFEFSPANLPVRIFLARFLRYQMDKIETPQFFCWPGMCMSSYRHAVDPDRAIALFDEHAALFLDKPDGDVYPRILPGRDNTVVHKVFTDFYVWVCIYELTRQWIVDDGPFDYDFMWLTSKHSLPEIKEWAANYFKQQYLLDPDTFRIASANQPP